MILSFVGASLFPLTCVWDTTLAAFFSASPVVVIESKIGKFKYLPSCCLHRFSNNEQRFKSKTVRPFERNRICLQFFVGSHETIICFNSNRRKGGSRNNSNKKKRETSTVWCNSIELSWVQLSLVESSRVNNNDKIMSQWNNYRYNMLYTSHETIWMECNCESNMRLIYFTRCNHIQVFGVFAVHFSLFSIFLRANARIGTRRKEKLAVNGKPDSITWHFFNGVFVTHSNFICELFKGFSTNEMASTRSWRLLDILFLFRLDAGCFTVD